MVGWGRTGSCQHEHAKLLASYTIAGTCFFVWERKGEENKRGRDRERRLWAANPRSPFKVLPDLNQAVPCAWLSSVRWTGVCEGEARMEEKEDSEISEFAQSWLPKQYLLRRFFASGTIREGSSISARSTYVQACLTGTVELYRCNQ